MRLLRVVDELQKLRAERAQLRKAAESRIGIAWSHCDRRLDDVELAAGELLALDITIVGAIGEIPQWRTVERVTRDPNDYGAVYDAAGVRVGSVRAIKGGLVTLAIDGAGAEASAVVSDPAFDAALFLGESGGTA